MVLWVRFAGSAVQRFGGSAVRRFDGSVSPSIAETASIQNRARPPNVNGESADHASGRMSTP
jgi:hypothetical protein